MRSFSQPRPPRLDLLAIGEVLVDFVSSSEAQASGWGFAGNPGGAPANVAVGLARLGRKAGFLGAVSRDFFGQWLLDVLRGEGVDCDGLPRCDEPTTLAFVHLDDDGERRFSFYREATSDTRLKIEDISDELLAGTRAIHVCSVSLSRSPAREATQWAVRRARELGLYVSFDVNLRERLWADLEEAKTLIRRLLLEADLVKLSEEELAFVSPDGTLESLIDWVVVNRATLDRPDRSELAGADQAGLWIVTQGSGPVIYRWNGKKGEVDAFPTNAVDTTGAGDAFVAGLLSQLAANDFVFGDETALCDAITYAHAAAALCVGRYGAIPSLATHAEVEAFLRERSG